MRALLLRADSRQAGGERLAARAARQSSHVGPRQLRLDARGARRSGLPDASLSGAFRQYRLEPGNGELAQPTTCTLCYVTSIGKDSTGRRMVSQGANEA